MAASDEKILKQWQKYITKYENILITKQATSNLIDTIVREQIAMQQMHLVQLKIKYSYLQNYYTQYSELPSDVTFDAIIEGGVGMYRTASDAPIKLALLNYGPSGTMIVNAPDFTATLIATNSNIETAGAHMNSGVYGMTLISDYVHTGVKWTTTGDIFAGQENADSWPAGTYWSVGLRFNDNVQLLNQIDSQRSINSWTFDGGANFDLQEDTVLLNSPWDYYNEDILPIISPNNAIFSNGYVPIDSPLSLNLWSIKETKDDIKVANTFPYDGHDAGDGTFFSLVRTKIIYNSLERDDDSNIVVKGLKFNFEDAVRKICQKESSDTPEKFLLATYSLENINSQDSFIPLGEMKKGDTSIETPALVTLKNNSTIGAFYKGQLVSNYNISNPDYKISVTVNWKGKPDSESWQGTAIIDVVNALTDEIIQTQIIDQPINNTYSFYLPSSTDDGEEIPYKINYKINDENNDWTVDPIQNNIIYYKDKKHSINIVNRWNKIIYDNTDTVIINVEKFDTDFKTKQVSEFFAYLKTRNAILDWEQEIKNNNNYKRMKENTAKIFCAQYKWSEHNGENVEECFILIPFLSVAIKDIYGVVNIYTFHLRSPYVIDSDTPLKKDMYNGDLSIIWPYISQREYKYVDGNENKEWQLGAESTKLFGRKGCYEESDGQISLYYNWTNDKDIYYKEPPTGKTSNFYIGEPHISLPNEKYTTVNNSILYSKIDLSEDNDRRVLLSNFCIYCIDENCISDTSVEAVIPYYYKATILFPYGQRDDNLANGAGVIRADIFFNNKNNYWNIDAPDIAAPADSPYKVHKWQNYGINNYVDYQSDFIITNTEKIRDAAADVIGESFFNESKAILD